jgi:hypothetical protein
MGAVQAGFIAAVVVFVVVYAGFCALIGAVHHPAVALALCCGLAAGACVAAGASFGERDRSNDLEVPHFRRSQQRHWWE